MSLWVEKQLERFAEDSDSGKAALARTVRGNLIAWRNRYGDISLHQSSEENKTVRAKETPLCSYLEATVRECVNRYMNLGFHTFVYPNIREEEAVYKYRKDFAIPEGARKPEEYDSRFDLVLAIEPRVSLPRKCKRARIGGPIEMLEISDLTPISDKPYIVFTHDGTRYYPYTVKQALTRFSEDEVAEPLTETIDLYLKYPALLASYRGRDAAGSRTEDGLVPNVDNTTIFGTFIQWARPGASHQRFGVGSRGKKIIELGI